MLGISKGTKGHLINVGGTLLTVVAALALFEYGKPKVQGWLKKKSGTQGTK